MDALFGIGNLWTSLAVLLPLALVAGAVKGTTGFGFGLTFIPVLLLLLREPGHAIAIVIPVSILMDMTILATSRRYINLSSALPMVVAGLAGVPLGTLVLLALPVDIIKVLISLAILAVVVMTLRGFTLRTRHTTLARVVAGFASGVMLTSTGMPGPAFSVFLVSLGIPKERFRPTFSTLFFALGAAALVSYGLSGVMTTQTLRLDLVLLPVVATGFLVATRVLLPRVRPEVFRGLVLLLVTLAAVLALVNTLLAVLS